MSRLIFTAGFRSDINSVLDYLERVAGRAWQIVTLVDFARRLIASFNSREAERRQVTLLVCRCATFETEAYLELDPEDQASLAHEFQQVCAAAMRPFAGTQVQGNEHGLLVCFGYPVAFEDAARRAARSALGLMDSLKSLGEQVRRDHKVDLNAWVGLHTGPVIVETTADTVTLVGEARTVALRLEDDLPHLRRDRVRHVKSFDVNRD